jgi:prevent-host-death family protein
MIGIRGLRADLASFVRRAGAGERIEIAVGGRPVAVLGPLTAPATTLADLVARGDVVPPRREDRPPPDVVVAVRVGTRLDRLVGEVR